MGVLATLNNRQVPAGVDETPGVAVPQGLRWVNLHLRRENWPAAGVTITLLVSYDNQQSWNIANSSLIAPGTTSAKDPVLRDAVIGMGWGSRAPTHAKAGSSSPSTFRTDLMIEGE